MDKELCDRREHVPPAGGVFGGDVANKADEAKAATAGRGGNEIGGAHAAVARLTDGAHGGEGELDGRGVGGADEALKEGAGCARSRREVDVDVGDEGSGSKGDEDDGYQTGDSDLLVACC